MTEMNWWDNRDLSQSIEIEDITITVKQKWVLHRDGTVTRSKRSFYISQENFDEPDEKTFTGVRRVDIVGALGAEGENTSLLWKE